MSDRKRPRVVEFPILFVVLLIGLMGLSRVMERPRFDFYRTLDVRQLVASGACFGAALTGVMFTIFRPRG